jgi:hypothetical protein
VVSKVRFEDCKSKNSNRMDSGPSIRNDKTKTSNSISNVSSVLQSFRIRRDTDIVNEFNRFLLWSQFGVVLPCGILFWIILLLIR